MADKSIHQIQEARNLEAEGANENWVSESSKFQKLINKAKYYATNQDKLNELITQAYNKATKESGNRTVQEMFGKLVTVFRMVRAHFRNEYSGLSTGKVIVGIGVLLYFILPFDIVPDWIPLAGYIDDASLLTWFIKNSADEVNKFQEWEASQHPTPLPAY